SGPAGKIKACFYRAFVPGRRDTVRAAREPDLPGGGGGLPTGCLRGDDERPGTGMQLCRASSAGESGVRDAGEGEADAVAAERTAPTKTRVRRRPAQRSLRRIDNCGGAAMPTFTLRPFPPISVISIRALALLSLILRSSSSMSASLIRIDSSERRLTTNISHSWKASSGRFVSTARHALPSTRPSRAGCLAPAAS